MDARENVIALFETEYMRRYIAKHYDELSLCQIADLVKGSRATIREKHDIYEVLSGESAFFIPYRDVFEYALQHMNPNAFGNKDPVAYAAKCMHIDMDSPNPDLIEMFSYSSYPTFESAVDGISRIADYEYEHLLNEGGKIDPWDERSWVEVEKCIFDSRGITRTPIKYWCDICGNPRYFELTEPYQGESFEVVSRIHAKKYSEKSFGQWDCWPSSVHPPELRLDLKEGDVVRIDGMPYVEPRLGVVTFSGKCYDSFFIYEGDDGAVHECSFRSAFLDRNCEISPLYRLEKCQDELPEDSPWRGLSEFCKEHPDASTTINRHLGANELVVGPRELLFLMLHSDIREYEETDGNDSHEVRCVEDILEFIDSSDIRRHCLETGWDPNSLEASFLVWQSRTHTIKERHDAWSWIIENMPDMPITESGWRDKRESLHESLRAYMSIEKRLLAGLFESPARRVWKPSEYYWTCDIEYDNSDGYFDKYGFKETGSKIVCDEGRLCNSFNELIGDLISRLSEEGEDYLGRKISFIITRQSFSCEWDQTQVRFSCSFEPITILRTPIIEDADTDGTWRLSFEGMWFDIPTPFKLGDILHYVDLWSSPKKFAATSLNADYSTEWRRDQISRRSGEWDTTDMTISGCEVYQDDGHVEFHCHEYDYLHMGFYRGELEGYERKLRPLGDLIAGRIGIRKCIKECQKIDLDTESRRKEKAIDEQFRSFDACFGFDAVLENYAGLQIGETWLLRQDGCDL